MVEWKILIIEGIWTFVSYFLLFFILILTLFFTLLVFHLFFLIFQSDGLLFYPLLISHFLFLSLHYAIKWTFICFQSTHFVILFFLFITHFFPFFLQSDKYSLLVCCFLSLPFLPHFFPIFITNVDTFFLSSSSFPP